MLVIGSPGDHLPGIDQLAALASEYPTGAAFIGVFGLIGLVLAYLALRAVWRTAKAGLGVSYRTAKIPLAALIKTRPAEDILTIAVACIATGVSAQGMWRFTGDVLGFDGPLRALLFAFIELAVLTSAVRARRNMRENYSAGIDGIAVWVLACLTAVLSSLDARSLAEAIFRLAAPLVAAWLWERGMAIERRRIRGRSAIHWRITPERVLVRLGLADSSERTASEVDAQRRLTRVALAAKKARSLRDAGTSPRRQRWALAALERAYTAAHAHTALGRDKAAQQALAAEVASLFSATGLLDVAPASAWTTAAEKSAPLPDAHLINAGLSRWSREMLREPANLVAGHDHHGDQVATTTATNPATTIPAPQRRIVGAPGSPWPIGRLVPFQRWTRPDQRLAGGQFPLPPVDNEQGGHPASTGREDAAGARPGNGQDGDQKEPTEQDRRRVAQWWARRVKAGEVLSKWKLANRSGFKPTWCGDRIAEGKELLARQGWTFDANGRPVRPASESTDPVASAARPGTGEPSVNGCRPVSA